MQYFDQFLRILLVSSIGSLLASIASAWATNAFLEGRIAIVGEWVGLQHSLNPGIAFGVLLPAGLQTPVIFIALLFVAWLGYKHAKTGLQSAAFGMIIGGGLANIIDRLGDGTVTDMLQVGSFPIFNLADSFISVGVGLLLFEAFVEHLKQQSKADKKDS